MNNIKLRQHQSEMNMCIDGIIAGTHKFKNIKNIIVSACPAAGKGSIPVNAGKLIMSGLADALVIVVPRKSLQTQCEAVFQDKFFKKLFGVSLQVRASTNETNPSRGYNGFVTTIQALGHDKHEKVLEFMKGRRCILINDENHHQAVDSPWHLAMEKLMTAAKYVILTSGTLSRADKQKIAFMKYRNGYVDLSSTETTHVIEYTRSDALREKAILPIAFHLYDSSAEWEEHSGQVKEVKSFLDVKDEDRSKALYTALQTEFAKKLIEESLSHWLDYKSRVPVSKILFICARIGDARKCMEYLRSLGVPSLLATSHESKECIQNIEQFKRQAPVLVTISVCYEGLDVPSISHICILTRIRSNEWLEQAVSRATRVNKQSGPYRTQKAEIFAPKDPKFLEFVDAIKKEQKTMAISTHEEDLQLPLFELPELNEGNGEHAPCKPLKSQILELSRTVLGNQKVVWERKILTPKQEEMDIRHDIDRYLKRYARDQGYEVMEVNRSAKEINQKPRNLMTLDELRYFFNRIQTLFPLVSRGSFVPISNCQPIFDSKQKEFNLESESFF